MLRITIEHIKNSSFLTPFFFGAAVCALVGGFINLFLISLCIFLGTKLMAALSNRGVPSNV